MRLGADPEVFLKDRNNKHLSVIGMIGAVLGIDYNDCIKIDEYNSKYKNG